MTKCDTCEEHGPRGERMAITETRLTGLEAWQAESVKLNRDEHKAILDAIQGLRDDMMHNKGAGWMLLKVGAFVVGAIALFAALWKIFKP